MTTPAPAESLAAAAERVRQPYSAEYPALVAPALVEPLAAWLEETARFAAAYARAILTATPAPQGKESKTGLSEPQKPVQAIEWPDYVTIATHRADDGRDAWAARCWGAGPCDGWLSLGNDTKRWAEVALARHLTEEHGLDVDLPEPALSEPQAGADGPGPRQAAYDAVYAYIRNLGDLMPGDQTVRNAMIWRAVHAALGALVAADTEPPPPTAPDAGLRERIAAALDNAATGWNFGEDDDANLVGHLADAVMAVVHAAMAAMPVYAYDGPCYCDTRPRAEQAEADLARLRARLTAERDKAAAAAAAPRPADREHLALAHDGIRAGLDIALRLLDGALGNATDVLTHTLTVDPTRLQDALQRVRDLLPQPHHDGHAVESNPATPTA